MIVSIMMSCTETVIYTITIYYMSVNIKNTLDFAGSDVCDDSRSGGERGNNGIDYVI